MAGWDELVELWVSATLVAAGRSAKTVELRRYQVLRLARELQAVTPRDIDADKLEQWFARQSWGRESRRSYTAAIRSFCRWSVRKGHADVDASIDLPRINPEPPNPRPASAEVVASARMLADERVELMVTMAATLGLRRGEVARAHTDDLEQDVWGDWRLIVHGKGDKLRRVPVPPPLAARIRRAPRGFLFPGEIDGHLAPATVGRLVSRVMPDGWAMHTLRHRFATLAHDHERDVLTVQQLLGHSSPATTQRYVLVRDARLRSTVEAVARAG